MTNENMPIFDEDLMPKFIKIENGIYNVEKIKVVKKRILINPRTANSKDNKYICSIIIKYNDGSKECINFADRDEIDRIFYELMRALDTYLMPELKD